MKRMSLWFLAAALLMSGCNGGDALSKTSKDEEGSQQSNEKSGKENSLVGASGKAINSQGNDLGNTGAETEEKPEREPIESVDSVEGNWFLAVNMQQRELNFKLVSITKEDDEYIFRSLDDTPIPDFPKFTLNDGNVDGKNVTLEMTYRGNQLTFRGVLGERAILGSLHLAGQGPAQSARLMPTSATEFEPDDAAPSALDGLKELAALREAEDKLAAVKDFCKDYSDSPLCFNACEQVLGMAKTADLTEEQVKELAEFYIGYAENWGQPMVLSSKYAVSYHLVNQEVHLGVAKEYLTSLENDLKDSPQEDDWTSMLAEIRTELKIVEAEGVFQSGNEDEKQQMVKELEELASRNGFNSELTYLLASYAESTGKLEEAINRYAQIVALPGTERALLRSWTQAGERNPLPSEKLNELWKKTERPSEEKDEVLLKAYKDQVYSFAKERIDTPDQEGNKIALVELFTGAWCPPCVAADVATGALEKTYSKEDVVVLRYHQHIPGPDPLTNKATEARFTYYQGRGTPYVALNGRESPPLGGSFTSANSSYDRLMTAIAPLIAQETPVTIKPTAKAENGELKIDVTVSGLDNDKENLKLVLVLAEEEIPFPAYNGVRLHEMVVRSMPAGATGAELNPEELQAKWSGTVSLADFKSGLEKYLTDFETGNQFEFPEKPLDLHELYLVAFVQDEKSKEVFQTAIVKVEGELVYPKAAVEPLEAPKPEGEEELNLESPENGPALEEPKVDESADEPKAEESTEEPQPEEPKAEEATPE